MVWNGIEENYDKHEIRLFYYNVYMISDKSFSSIGEVFLASIRRDVQIFNILIKNINGQDGYRI